MAVPVLPNQGQAYPEAPEFTDDQMDMEVWARYNGNYRYYDWDPDGIPNDDPPVAPRWVQRETGAVRTGVHYANELQPVRDEIRLGTYPSLRNE